MTLEDAAIHAQVRLWLVSNKTQVVIWVWDASPLPPERADAGSDAESGRGLMLVEAISARWGGTSRRTWAGRWYGPA